MRTRVLVDEDPSSHEEPLTRPSAATTRQVCIEEHLSLPSHRPSSPYITREEDDNFRVVGLGLPYLCIFVLCPAVLHVIMGPRASALYLAVPSPATPATTLSTA
ncbi:hypothetical protein E2C01_094085 [Portunus trituberculatus]|uniref:Uncharacterized protein n=1 Tax=Portunus trituberculatus TaxID=210409 RepID=A0A5B7JW01_PORTR|nr:hypothetical protein [Portunus trituberculatus]